MTERGVRPDKWAKWDEIPGVPNLWQVTPTLYRSAQPTARGFSNLIDAGFEIVINLRAFHKDPEMPALISQPHISFKTWHPERDDIEFFFEFLQRVPGKALVHCQHGADRTGTMVALYRAVVQRWPVEDAIDEMTHGGFGYHAIWHHLPRFVRKMARELS